MCTSWGIEQTQALGEENVSGSETEGQKGKLTQEPLLTQ